MERYKDYVPFYDQAKIKESKYAFMYIDGPHHLKAVLEETQFFAERMSIGGYILYDNVGYYPHDQVHSYLLSSGFTEIDFAGEKRLYKHEGISTKKVA
jgi:cephalosporin hydroxylase